MPCPRCQAPIEEGSHFCTSCGLPVSGSRVPTAVDPLIGRVLNNRYRVLSKLGEGGFGAVYRGEQLQMDRPVALKILHRHMAQDPQLVQRFQREAKSACNLRDPHTIITYDFDQTDDGLLYIAMELLNGRSLFDILRNDGPMPAQRVCYIIDQVCSSLDEAHRQGLVHRDIKPENIIIEEREGNPDFVKVLDFGIAKIVRGDAAQQALTAAGETIGTLEYMPPEQLKGQPLDGRADIYALGIMMYQMLTGDLPFRGDTPASIITKHLMEKPVPPSKYKPELTVPAPIEQVVLTMLEKDREKRYANVGALRQALAEAAKSVGGAAPGPQLRSTGAVVPGTRAIGVPGTAVGAVASATTPAAGGLSGKMLGMIAAGGVIALVGIYSLVGYYYSWWPFDPPPIRRVVRKPVPRPPSRVVRQPTRTPTRVPVRQPVRRRAVPNGPRSAVDGHGTTVLAAAGNTLPVGSTPARTSGTDILALVPVQMGALIYADLAALQRSPATASLFRELDPFTAEAKRFGVDLRRVRKVVAAVPLEDASVWANAGLSAAGRGGRRGKQPDRVLLIAHGGFEPDRVLASLKDVMVKAGERPAELKVQGARVLRGHKNVAAVLNDGQTVVISHQNPHPLVLGAQPGKTVTGLPALLRAVGFGPGAAKPAVMLAMRTNAALRAQMASPQFPEASRIDGLVIHASTPGGQLAVGIDFQCRDAATAAAIDQRLKQLVAQGQAQAPATLTSSANPSGQLGAQLLGRVRVQTQGHVSRVKLTLTEPEVATLATLLKELTRKG